MSYPKNVYCIYPHNFFEDPSCAKLGNATFNIQLSTCHGAYVSK
jgi:hypothetical protein